MLIEPYAPHFKVVLDIRRKNKNEEYPLKLRITHKNKRNYLSLRFSFNYHFSRDAWNRVSGYYSNKNIRLSSEEKILLDEIHQYEIKAVEVAAQIRPFVLERFKQNYFSNSTDERDVFNLMQKYIDHLTKEDRYGTAASYKCAFVSLRKYHGRKHLDLLEVNKEWLTNYQVWMTTGAKPKSKTTVAIYLRSLRTILNEAKETGLITPKDYPFGRSRQKFSIPESQNLKKALKKEDILKIMEYECSEDNFEAQARDYWLLSYFCNGMNPKDILGLKYQNIHGNKLFFTRKKSKNTKSVSKEIKVTLRPEAMQIIERRGQSDKAPNNYVFPFLNLEMSEEQIFKKSLDFVRLCNQYTKKIGEKLNLPIILTSYVARHSFATALSRNGLSTETIQAMLGHSDIRVTQAYIDTIIEDSYDSAYDVL